MGTLNGLLNRALSEVGYLEKKSNSQLDSKTANAGSANYTKYGRDMHNLYPSVMDFPASWCDAFVDWLFYKEFGVCNAKGLLGGDFNDYTVSSAQLYKNKGAWYTSNPKVGDQIFFKNSSRICHTGLVIDVTATHVITIEGNTSGASGVIANGGGVCRKSYSLSYSKIAGYGRPAYNKFSDGKTTATTVVSSSVLKLGSKGSEVKELQQNLIKLGYSCGSAGADGDFGNSTLAAVKKFQKDKGLTVDGIVGSATQAKIKECIAALNKPTTSIPSTNTSTSSTASSKYNEKILNGQKWLNANYGDKLIKYCGGKLVENGIYNAKTRAAIVCVWKDLMNRKYGTNLTPSNSNFLSSCEAAAKNATIELGDSGTFVYLAQMLLVAEGIYNGSMDGSYGSSMKSAMIRYQKKVFPNAPKEWDGIGGTKFWMKIMN